MSDLSLPFHPTTGLQAVGIVAGRPVWPILGGEDDPANPVQPPAADPAPPAADPEPPAGAPAAGGAADPDPVDDDPEPPAPAAGDDPAVAKARKQAAGYRDRLRTEAAARKAAEEETEGLRAQAAEADKLRSVLEGLNKVLNPDASPEEAADPAKLMEQLATQEKESAAAIAKRDAQIRSLTIEAALPGILADADADPLLVKVLKADGVLDSLDPEKRTFRSDLASAVEKALEANPRLKATPAVTKTGTEPTGKSAGSDQLTEEQVNRMTPEQITEALKAGKLKRYLTGGR